MRKCPAIFWLWARLAVLQTAFFFSSLFVNFRYFWYYHFCYFHFSYLYFRYFRFRFLFRSQSTIRFLPIFFILLLFFFLRGTPTRIRLPNIIRNEYQILKRNCRIWNSNQYKVCVDFFCVRKSIFSLLCCIV